MFFHAVFALDAAPATVRGSAILSFTLRRAARLARNADHAISNR